MVGAFPTLMDDKKDTKDLAQGHTAPSGRAMVGTPGSTIQSPYPPVLFPHSHK